ncbi:metallopeptidase catalytic domain protein [Vibrio phage 1.121.O._10N.286.46.C4]|nr:metallopeptidase catalytic domain protein [Vibrio phage 1.121.O._10N.286.46.C4]
MWTKRDIKGLWNEVLTKFKEEHPQYAASLKKEGYVARVVEERNRKFGYCSYRDKLVVVNWFLHRNSNKEDIVDTMLHELAHAVDNAHYGKYSGHGALWKKISKELGNNPKAISKSAKKVQYKFVMCADLGDTLIWAGGHQRKPNRKPVGVFLKGYFLPKDKESTMDKIICYTWEDWCKRCFEVGRGIYKEEL